MKPSIVTACIFGVGVLLATALYFVGDGITPSEERPENLGSESSQAGVIIHGMDSPGWIQNTTSNTLRVKAVWIFRGETTQWIRELKPTEKMKAYISNQHGFHVYTLDGAEIAWITPVLNGPRSVN
jgi:hypothetical protein